MSEDYKKIALEDVKKGQRIRVVEQYRAYTATSEGVVVRKDTDSDTIVIVEEGFQVTIFAEPGPGVYFDILLLEDAPKPKVVRTFLTDMFTDGVTYFEDTGTLRFASVEHWDRYEPMLRGKRLKDLEGDVWAYVDGQWRYKCDGRVGAWKSDYPIGDFVKDGFTIVGGLD